MGGFVKVDDFVTIQTSAVRHPHKHLNPNCTIGAGAVVLRNVKNNITVIGNPAIKLEL